MATSPDDLLRFSRADLAATAADRPVGYESTILSAAERYDDRHYWIRRGAFRQLVQQFAGHASPTTVEGGCSGCGG